MTSAEMIASASSLDTFNKQHQYVLRFNTLAQKVQNVLPNRIQEDWYLPIFNEIDQLQLLCASWEDKQSFPMDNNPFILDLGIENFISIGGLESLKQFIKSKPSQVPELISEGQAKIQLAFEIISSLNQQFKRLPTYSSNVEFYVNNTSDKILTRIVFAPTKSQDLDSESEESQKLLKNLKSFDKLQKEEGAYVYEIIGMSKSSPLEALLLVSAKCGFALNLVTRSVIKRWSEAENVRLVRAQIENIKEDTQLKKVQKQKLLSELEPIETEGGNFAENLSEEIYEELGDKDNLDGSENEVKKSLKESVKYFEDIIENGGSVNVYIAPKTLQSRNPDGWKSQIIEGRRPRSSLESPKKRLTDSTDQG